MRWSPPRRAWNRARCLLVVALCGVLAAGTSAASPDEAGGEPGAAHGSSSPVPAPETYRSNEEDDWKFYAALPVWFLFINGAIEVRDQTTPIDINFDNIWSQLHMALYFEGEVQKGDFGVFTDLAWAYLWNRQQGQVFNFETEMDWVLFDFGLYWEALELDFGSGPLPPRLRLQPYFGARYMFLGMETKVRPTPDDRVLTPVLNTAAPVLGLRGFVDFGEHWNLLFTGDGGGFGVDAIEVTWLAELQGGYRFRFQRWDLNVLVGYKAVGLDLASGAKDIEGNFIFHGPVLKLAAEF